MMTIEMLENLANEIETEENLERARLARLIRAYARIASKADPQTFPARAIERSDEDGHWDNSFPPDIELKNHCGPRAICIFVHNVTDIATSSGYYHSWRRETEYVGLYVRIDGALLGCTETGTGSVGQYAAHPGDHGVECTLEYEARDLEDIELEDLQAAEASLREIAFPLIAARWNLTAEA